jgi:hypothetical protein
LKGSSFGQVLLKADAIADATDTEIGGAIDQSRKSSRADSALPPSGSALFRKARSKSPQCNAVGADFA